MSTISEKLREERRERERAMTPAQRVRRALSLGESAIEIYQSAQRLSREEALRRLERTRQTGRLRSQVMLDVTE